MHIKHYMHDNLTAAEHLYQFFPCNTRKLSAADLFQFLQNSNRIVSRAGGVGEVVEDPKY